MGRGHSRRDDLIDSPRRGVYAPAVKLAATAALPFDGATWEPRSPHAVNSLYFLGKGEKLRAGGLNALMKGTCRTRAAARQAVTYCNNTSREQRHLVKYGCHQSPDRCCSHRTSAQLRVTEASAGPGRAGRGRVGREVCCRVQPC